MPITSHSIREEAGRFFEWCPFNMSRVLETLSPEERREFDSGKMPKGLLSAVENAWLKELRTSLPWADQFAAVRKALPSQQDYNTFMHCPMGELEKLPKRILHAVSREDRRQLRENYSTFRANGGQARLETYLRVWQSQSLALNRLIIDAWGYRRKAAGGASIGATEIDVERMMLSEAEATGSAMKVRGLLLFIRNLWEREKPIIVKTNKPGIHPSAADWGPGFERRVVPNEDMNEPRLNRFLIKLGRALASTEKRRELPDWSHMDQTITFVVHGWCQNIIVDELRWPALCFFTTPALAKFLSLCSPPRWKAHQDPRTLERKIQRLGLIRIPAGRIRNATKTANQICFS